MYELAGTYAALAINAGVEIRLNTEATAEYVEREGADALIIAVGSESLRTARTRTEGGQRNSGKQLLSGKRKGDGGCGGLRRRPGRL